MRTGKECLKSIWFIHDEEGTGTRRAEMQMEISRGAIKEGRRDSVPIKGIMTLPLFDSLVTSVVVCYFHLS